MSWNAEFHLDSVCVNITVFRPVTVHVDNTLMTVALTGLDEKQFGFPSQGSAFCSNERFHQHPDVDSVAVHAVHTALQAVAENKTHHAVPFLPASVGQVLHQGQHLLARTVPLHLHLKAKPAEDFSQTL